MTLLNAQTVADLQEACGAELVWGDPELLQRESMGSWAFALVGVTQVMGEATVDGYPRSWVPA
jgi:hypothetical protein